MAILNHACRLPELPQKLNARACKEIKGVIRLQQSAIEPKNFTISLDSLADDVKSLEWKIDNVVIKDTSKSFPYTFATIGEHNISVLVKDYCAKSVEIKKKSSVCENLKGVISFKPIETEKGYFILVDSLKGNVSKVSWFVNGKKLVNNKIDFGNNKNLTVTYAGTQELGMWAFFSDDGNYDLVAEVQDSCGKILQAKKTLNITTTYVSIPDPNFEQKLIDLGIDNDKKINARIWEGDALKVTDLNITESLGVEYNQTGNVMDLSGIESFKNLKTLNCANNKILTLNISNNNLLEELECGGNYISQLDLNKNLSLRILQCAYNKLKTININQNIKLTYVNCLNNQLNNLDISNNISLFQLSCSKNLLRKLDLSKNTSLSYLYCGDNQLTELILPQNSKLNELFCHDNNLSSLDLSKSLNLSYLSCSNNSNLSNLDISKNLNLSILNCDNNNLSSLDVSKNLNLSQLFCGRNNIGSLNILTNKNLFLISCYSTGLSSLDVSANTILKYLACHNNFISNLNLSKNTFIINLMCGNNKLTALDLSKNPDLEALSCVINPSLFTICVQDVAKAKSNPKFQKDSQAEWVKCN